MITLIVGVPGSGKTWYAVEKLIPKLMKRKKKCFSNIREHTDAHKTFGFEDDFTVSEFDNSLVILDEVQFFSLRDSKGLFFQHLTIHRHTGRDYIFITQSVAAIPRKWHGLIEKTIEISSIAGSQYSRARHYQGLPKLANPVLAEEKFHPCATDKYKTVEDGVDETKRAVPFYVWKMAFGLFATFSFTAFLGFAVYNHFFNEEHLVKEALASTTPVIDQLEKSKTLKPDSPQGDKLNNEFPPVNPQLSSFPMGLDDALAFLDSGDEIQRVARCGGNVYSDNPYYKCNQKSRTLVSGNVQSFRLSSDYSYD